MVFKGTSDPIVAHAIRKSGYTESDVGGGGPVVVLDRSSEALQG